MKYLFSKILPLHWAKWVILVKLLTFSALLCWIILPKHYCAGGYTWLFRISLSCRDFPNGLTKNPGVLWNISMKILFWNEGLFHPFCSETSGFIENFDENSVLNLKYIRILFFICSALEDFQLLLSVNFASCFCMSVYHMIFIFMPQNMKGINTCGLESSLVFSENRILCMYQMDILCFQVLWTPGEFPGMLPLQGASSTSFQLLI